MRNNQKAQSVYDKAIALCEGRPVRILGHAVKLCKMKDFGNPCYYCEMDSICREEMVDVCMECESITREKCYLQLIVQV